MGYVSSSSAAEMASPSPCEKKLTTRPRNVGTPAAFTNPRRRQSKATPVLAGNSRQTATSEHGAIRGQYLALDRFPDCHAVRVHRHPHRKLPNIHLRHDPRPLVLEPHHGSFPLRQPLFNQRDDLHLPDRQGRLSFIPIRQPPNPLCQEHP